MIKLPAPRVQKPLPTIAEKQVLKRAIPWVVAAVAVIAFGASFSELQRMRARFGEVTRHQFHDHQDVRLFAIRAALGEANQPIVIIGDSITEMSRLPETINGRPVVNAGIGGATISDFRAIAPRMLEGSNPSLMVVALGANGAGSLQEDYAALLRQLRKWSPRLLAIAVTPMSGSDLVNIAIRAAAQSEGVQFVEMPMPAGSTLADHVHLNAAGYRIWTPALVAAIASATG